MSAPTRHEQIKAALLTRLQTVDGFTSYLPYEPLVIQDAPLLYVLFDRFEDVTHAQQVDRTYFYLVRSVFQWVDVEQAEIAIDPYVDALATCIYADIMLGGVVSRGRATVAGMRGTFLTWQGDGPTYRCLDMTVAVLDKVPWRFHPPGEGSALL